MQSQTLVFVWFIFDASFIGKKSLSLYPVLALAEAETKFIGIKEVLFRLRR